MADAIGLKVPLGAVTELPTGGYGVVGYGSGGEARYEFLTVEALHIESVATLAERVVASHVDEDAGLDLHVHIGQASLFFALDVGVFELDAGAVGQRNDVAANEECYDGND